MVVTTRSQSRQRDWTSLPGDIAALIADFLLADDLAHFVRLRSVCRNWRDSTAFLLKTRAGLFLPRDWILLPSSPHGPPRADQLEFFNTASGKRFSTEVSLLSSDPGYSLYRSVNCFLVLVERMTDGPTVLYNPFTRSHARMPPMAVSRCGKPPVFLSMSLIGGYVTPTAVFFLMHYPAYTKLVWKNHGDDAWFYSDTGISCYDYCFDDGFLYGMDFDRGLVRINLVLANEIMADPVVEILAPCPVSHELIVEIAFLFNCGGKIVLVLFSNDESGNDNYDVFQLDRKDNAFVMTKNINEHAIFISLDKNFSVSSKKLATVPANSVFLCGLTGDKVTRYDVCWEISEPYSFEYDSCIGHLIRYCFDGAE